MVQLLRAGYRLGRLLLAIAVTALALFYGGGLLFGLEPETMLTGSMGKTIPPGSLVLTRSVAPAALRVGDVVTFRKPNGAVGLDTHRIVEIRHSNGHTTYRTKGDANSVADPWVLQLGPHQSAHRVVYSVPFIGGVLLWTRRPVWTFLLVAMIALIVISTVLRAIAGVGEGSPSRIANEK